MPVSSGRPTIRGSWRAIRPTRAFMASIADLPAEISLQRAHDRSDLLGFVDRQHQQLDRSGPVRDFDAFRRQAMDVLASVECRRAFDLSREDPRLRDRYRRTLMVRGSAWAFGWWKPACRSYR